MFNAPDPVLLPKDRGPYYLVRLMIEKFNTHRKEVIVPGPVLTPDECISAWTGVVDTVHAGGCRGKTYIPRKPKSWGIELKVFADVMTFVILVLEIQEGKTKMKKKEYVNKYDATTATTNELLRLNGNNKAEVEDFFTFIEHLSYHMINNT